MRNGMKEHMVQVLVVKNVTCTNCGWVHFGVSKKYMDQQAKEFAEYFNSSNLETKKLFWNEKYRGPIPDKYPIDQHIKSYFHCARCGESYKNFRESKENDCPDGCTIGPILDFREPLEYDPPSN